jgi:pimeloyl-ACP methyl ester carboxylesterase
MGVSRGRFRRPVAAAAVAVGGSASAVLIVSPAAAGRLLLVAITVGLAAPVVLLARSRGTGLAALVLGTIGLAVGLSRGARHLTAAHVDIPALLAVIAGLGGLILVVAGGAALVSGWRWWGKALGITAAAVAALLGLYTFAIPLAATDPPRATVTGPTPAGWQEVRFSTADGVPLTGWYTPPGNGAAIVVAPGSGSSRSGALAQAQVLADAGYGVLVYDPRGHGGSGGSAMDLGWAGDADIRGAVDFLAATGARRIGALGLSMGGEQALGAAAADDRIEAVAAEGATHRTAADYAWLPEEFGWRGSVQQALNAARFAVVDLLAGQSPPTPLRDAVLAIDPRPVLLIAAGQVQDEQKTTTYLAAGNTQVWVVDAGHTAGLDTEPQMWRQRVVAFFDEALDR